LTALGSALEAKIRRTAFKRCFPFQLAPLQLGSVHKQRFVVTNQSNSSKRLHVIVPATPYFKAKCEKRGRAWRKSFATS
jgi:hypothetical protein